MKFSFCVIFFLIFTGSYSQEVTESSKVKLKAGGTISLNSNGIASIPAFSLDKPAVIATIILAKNRFSYEPQLAYGLDGRPWYIDNWVQYKIIDRPSFNFRTAANVSTFCSKYEVLEESILQGQRYYALALTVLLQIALFYLLTGMTGGRIKEH